MKHKLWIAVFAVVVIVGLVGGGIYFGVSRSVEAPFDYGFRSNEPIEVIQNFVVAGVDADGTRTDLILLCCYDFSDDSLDVLQIPRDTKVATKRPDKKINSAYGTNRKTEALFDDIQSLTGVRPEKYITVTFEGFRKLIDAIGGVEVEVPSRMYYTDPEQNLVIDLQAGKQILDGRHAEMFMRFRQNNDGSGYANGDVDRLAVQQKFYQAVQEKLLSVKNVLNAPEFLSIATESVATDFTNEEILKYLGRVPNITVDKVDIYSLPGEGGYDKNGVSYFFPDKAEIERLMKGKFGAKR